MRAARLTRDLLSLFLEADDKGDGQVITQSTGGAVAIALGNRLDDFQMLGQRLFPPPLGGQRGTRHQGHRAIHKVQLLHEIAVMAGQMNLVVKPPIGPRQGLRITQKRAVSLDHIAQDLNLLDRGMLGGQPGGQRLQLLAHGVKLGHLCVIERCHDQRTAITRQKPLCFEPLKRLADGCAADTEAIGQLGFDQPVAGPIDPLIDRIKDQGMRIFLGIGQGLGSHGRAVSFRMPPKARRQNAPCPDLRNALTRPRAVAMQKHRFSHVETWVFDLDNTLYPPETALFDQINIRMTAWVMQVAGVEQAVAEQLRHRYWREHGTTLAGLMRHHAIDPAPYLEDVHEIDFSVIAPDPALARAIAALPGRRIVYTNGTKPYAERVITHRGLSGLFDAVYGVEHAKLVPKPERSAFETVFAIDGLAPERAAMFEDDPRNLRVPHEMGMRTVHVAPEAEPAPFIEHHTTDLTAFLEQLV